MKTWTGVSTALPDRQNYRINFRRNLTLSSTYTSIVNTRLVLISNFLRTKRKRNEAENVRFVEGSLPIKAKSKWLTALCKLGFAPIEITWFSDILVSKAIKFIPEPEQLLRNYILFFFTRVYIIGISMLKLVKRKKVMVCWKFTNTIQSYVFKCTVSNTSFF